MKKILERKKRPPNKVSWKGHFMNWILAAALANAHRETYSGQINQIKKSKKIKISFKFDECTQ